MTVRNRDDRDEARSEDFRCPECEANTGNGKPCMRCRMERDMRSGPYCERCESRTNHTTEQHVTAEREGTS